MADTPQSSSDKLDIKQTIEMSREALAKKLGVSIDKLPQYEGVLKISKQQLDALKEITGKVSISEQLDALRQKISQIKAEDIKNKSFEAGADGLKGVQDFGEKSIDAAKKLTPEAMNTAITETTKTLKKDIGKGGTEVLGAVGDIVNAGNIEGATGGITKLSKAIDAISTTFSSAMKGIGDMLSAFMSMLGLDKLWGSIKGLFGGSSEEKKDGDSAKKKVEEGVDAAKKEGADLLEKGKKVLETPIDREKIISDMTTSLGNLIGERYFGKGVELSKDQLDKIKTIIGKNLNTGTLDKIRAQYMKDGTTRMGDVVDVNIDLMAKLPAGTFFDIALSGIIPTHKIIYNTVVEPSKNLIQLTFDGLPFVDMQMSLPDWSGLLSARAQERDSHALDLARVQLYAVNGLLWKTMGLVTSGIAAGGIAMLTDTVTGVNGFRMLGGGLSWNFDSLSRDIGTIESTLSGGTSPKGGSLGVLSDRLKGLQHNYLMMDLALKGNEDPSKMMNLLKDDSKYLSLKQNMKIADLELSVGNKEIFQRKMAGYLMSPDVTRDIGSATKIAWSKGIGGAEGSIRHYMETTDDLLAKQKNMFLAGNIRNVLGTPLLALKNMKMARSADSVLFHIDDAKDVSKLRAFLAVIPGGLKGLAEFIPATSIVFSIGSIAMDNKNEKGGVYESIMDVAKTVFVPAYGSVSMLMDKTVNIKSIISEGKMPPFGDMALTGVIGGVAVFETVRVANQVAIGSSMMYHGAVGQGAKTIAMAPFRGITDIVNAAGSAVRGVQNVRSLVSTPVANPAAAKALTNLAAKVPKKGRFAIGALALMAAGGAYAYVSGPEKPEDIMKNLHKDGWLDIGNNPTAKMKEEFQGKTPNERKNIIDELLIMHLGTTKDLPKTHYDEKLGKYTLITEGNFTGNNLIDSLFRNTLQSLGVDIDLQKA